MSVREAAGGAVAAPAPSAPRVRGSRRLQRWWPPLLALALVASVVVSVGLGPFTVSPSAVLDVVVRRLGGGGGSDATQDAVVWVLRVPRVLTGVCVGAALAVGGAALQAAVRNQLADPYLIGVSSGASLGAALVLTAGLGTVLGAVALTTGAFAGAVLALLLVLALVGTGRSLSTQRLVLAGLAVGYFLSALTSVVVVLSDDRDAVRAVTFWTLGSLGRAGWDDVPVLAVTSAVVVGLLTAAGRRLDVLGLGDDVARSSGVDPDRLRRRVAVLSAVGVAAAVAVSGSIGFVGLVVPHLARRLVGAAHRRVVPTSALLGALVVVWADTLARTALAPREVPIGVLTALLGTPLLMALVRRRPQRPE